MAWFQAVVGLLAVALALPAIYYAAKAAKYARDTVLLSALEADLTRLDEAEDRANRLVGSMREYAEKKRQGEHPDLADYNVPLLRDWQAAFMRLPPRVQDALVIDNHWKPGERGVPLTGAEGWDINGDGAALKAAILKSSIRTANLIIQQRELIREQRETVLRRIQE